MVKWIEKNDPNREKKAADNKALLLKFINAEKKIKDNGTKYENTIIPEIPPQTTSDDKKEKNDEWVELENKTVNVGSIKLNIPLDKRLRDGKMFNKMKFT